MLRGRHVKFLASAALIPLAAVSIAACGGSGNNGSASDAAATTSTSSSGAAGTVDVASSSLGSILVNSSGRTLYLVQGDVGTKSSCTGACATAWPPLLTTGSPTVGTGVTMSELGTTTRSNGTKQVTYNGHPLYLFVKDTQPGEINGQGSTAFGAPWYVLSPAGNQITAQPSGSSSSSSGGSSGGSSASGY